MAAARGELWTGCSWSCGGRARGRWRRCRLLGRGSSTFRRGTSSRFIDEEQLVVNIKKVEQELKWPDIDESWESLTSGITQLLTGISVHIVGDSTDISEAVAKAITEGIGYLPVCTSELLESATQKSIDTFKIISSFC